jgi:uncharacterized glyoxalase superfamily protein PhnB
MSTFKEFHASQAPEEDDLIMHSELEIENGMTLMAADMPSRGDTFGMCIDPFGVNWLVNISKESVT